MKKSNRQIVIKLIYNILFSLFFVVGIHSVSYYIVSYIDTKNILPVEYQHQFAIIVGAFLTIFCLITEYFYRKEVTNNDGVTRKESNDFLDEKVTGI